MAVDDSEVLYSPFQSNISPDTAMLNEVAYNVYLGWMAYYKGRNGRDTKSLIERLSKVKQLLESVNMWPPRVQP